MSELRTVTVKFDTSPGQSWTYFVPYGDEPQVGDWVLTSVNWDAENDAEFTATLPYGKILYAAKIGKVVDVDSEPNLIKAKKFYLMLIGREKLIATRKQNQKMMLVAKKRAEAVRRLETLVKEESRITAYERIAISNPEAAELLRIVRGEKTKKNVPNTADVPRAPSPLHNPNLSAPYGGPPGGPTTSSGESNNCDQEEGA